MQVENIRKRNVTKKTGSKSISQTISEHVTRCQHCGLLLVQCLVLLHRHPHRQPQQSPSASHFLNNIQAQPFRMFSFFVCLAVHYSSNLMGLISHAICIHNPRWGRRWLEHAQFAGLKRPACGNCCSGWATPSCLLATVVHGCGSYMIRV